MAEYSVELKFKAKKISIYYEKNYTFDFLQKTMYFMMECIIDYIYEKPFVIPKKYIASFVKEALHIWEKGGSGKELNKIKKIYLERMNETKSIEKILKNKKENAAMNCMNRILYNGYNDPKNQFKYNFVELFVEDLEKLEIKEEYINKSFEKYFEEII